MIVIPPIPQPPDPIATPVADLLAQQPVVDLVSWRLARLCELALAGDVDAAIAWLAAHDPTP
jgi:hypothetical protein